MMTDGWRCSGCVVLLALACTSPPPPQGCVTCHGREVVYWGKELHGGYVETECLECHGPAELYYVWNRGYLGDDVSPAEFWKRHKGETNVR